MSDAPALAPCAPDLLLLDLDGTLLDIAERPDAVVVEDTVRQALGVLNHCDPHGLVIVTGRALAVVDDLMAPLRLPAIASHGAEIRVPGTAELTGVAPILTIQHAIEALLRSFGAVTVEWKPFSVAVHVRSAPELEPAVGAALDRFVKAHPDYRLQRGRRVFEIVPAGVSKAAAVRRLLRQTPFDMRRAIYVGDDAADEAAMGEVLTRGGLALRVAGEHFAAASADFASPHHVRSWLCRRGRRAATAGTASNTMRCIGEQLS